MNRSLRMICSAMFSLVLFTATAQYVEQSYDLNQMGALKLAE